MGFFEALAAGILSLNIMRLRALGVYTPMYLSIYIYIDMCVCRLAHICTCEKVCIYLHISMCVYIYRERERDRWILLLCVCFCSRLCVNLFRCSPEVAVLLCGTASMFTGDALRFAWYGFGLCFACPSAKCFRSQSRRSATLLHLGCHGLFLVIILTGPPSVPLMTVS